MQRARSFFLACAGVFLLALSFHFGASTANSQTGTLIQGPDVFVGGASDGSPVVTGVVGRQMYSLVAAPGRTQGTGIGPLIPGSGAIIASGSNGSAGVVLLDNGDVYWSDPAGWHLQGNLTGAPTSSLRQSWSQLKTTYRK
jgi:hypothetical protein